MVLKPPPDGTFVLTDRYLVVLGRCLGSASLSEMSPRCGWRCLVPGSPRCSPGYRKPGIVLWPLVNQGSPRVPWGLLRVLGNPSSSVCILVFCWNGSCRAWPAGVLAACTTWLGSKLIHGSSQLVNNRFNFMASLFVLKEVEKIRI